MTRSGIARFAAVLILLLSAYAVVGWLPIEPEQRVAAGLTAAVTALTAYCWLSQQIPLGAASLLPMVLMPLCGVLPAADATSRYAHPVIWMFFGGFVLALAVERTGLHRRVALETIRFVGATPVRLVFGFMATSAFLSIFLNNTATALMLLPIALALIETMEEADAVPKAAVANFSFSLLLAVAYGCSIGGIGTPISTSPNALFMSSYAMLEAQGMPPVTFLTWSLIGVAGIVLMVPITWFLLVRVLAPVAGSVPGADAVIRQKIAVLPPMRSAERRVLLLFSLAALLWVTRRDLVLGTWGTLQGWWHWFPVEAPNAIADGTVAVAMVLLLFVIPEGSKDASRKLMDWDTAKGIPWDILLLIGGGMVIALSFRESGLAEGMALSLRPWVGQLHPVVLVLSICLMMTFLTELTSNTATTALFLPVLVSISTAASVDPRLLMIPATVSASFAFMLPIATPPNAIVFASGKIPMARMARTGFVLNLVGSVVLTALIWFWAVPLLGIPV